MTTSIRSAIPALVLAGLSLVLAVATGVEWLGKPLRLMHLLTIIGLSMTAGVSWMLAVWLSRQERPELEGLQLMRPSSGSNVHIEGQDEH